GTSTPELRDRRWWGRDSRKRGNGHRHSAQHEKGNRGLWLHIRSGRQRPLTKITRVNTGQVGPAACLETRPPAAPFLSPPLVHGGQPLVQVEPPLARYSLWKSGSAQ